MIFLIDYDGQRGEIVRLRQFKDTEKLRAQYELLQTELTLAKRGHLFREVVLLKAADLQALKCTHHCYFQTASNLAGDFIVAPFHRLPPRRYI
jgi:hypothetical protein